MKAAFYEIVDALVVLASIIIVGLLIGALIFHTVPEQNLPVVSGLGGYVAGFVSAYCAFRWSSSVTGRKAAEAGAEASVAATTALASIATNSGGPTSGGGATTDTMDVAADTVNVTKT